jgi:hypothetical protein
MVGVLPEKVLGLKIREIENLQKARERIRDAGFSGNFHLKFLEDLLRGGFEVYVQAFDFVYLYSLIIIRKYYDVLN